MPADAYEILYGSNRNEIENEAEVFTDENGEVAELQFNH